MEKIDRIFIQEVKALPRTKRTVIEYRNYELPLEFPIIVLSGDEWRISHVPSKRLHFHNCLEVGFCHSESGTLIFENTPAPFRAGDVTCIARNVPHTTYSADEKRSLWSYLFFQPDTLLQTFMRSQMVDNRVLYSMLRNSHMILPEAEYPDINWLVREIIREMEAKQPNYQLTVRSLCTALLLKLLRAYDADNAQSPSIQSDYAIAIAPALDYIHQHYAEEFPLEKLADECHLSAAHFRRLFMEIMKMSPLTFLHQTRVLASCTLLRSTKESVADISEQVGYVTLSTYNRHFMEFMGCTPSDWRRKLAPTRKPMILEYSGWMQAEHMDGENQ